ncbi:MAG TPA: carboxypeptidase regulatory-like domain-containing protein [Pyrinomonadaceae bacterium]|nr:carboxypeptidase regulatory-like domain-containing protein [Pyrinomonadaceae bacterium]
MRERKSSPRVFNLLSAAALCVAFCAAAFAQSTATLQGSVTDPQGAVVPDAKVTVRSQATSAERTAQTDADGNFQFASLLPGVYRLEVQARGFQTQIVAALNVEVARTVVQNFQLTVGNVAQEITVTSDAPVIETATTSVGTVISQRTVQEIPLNGRHFVDLGLLIPGSVTPPQNGFLTAPLRGQGSFAINTAGNREDTVNFQINGVNLNDMVQNQITFQPSINTVSEFKADNSTFSAEYGRNSGAVVNIATRSGTNAFHGELFEFLRNEALDARNFFDARKPPFKRNQFGAAVGGPLMLPHFGEGGSPVGYDGKNRTFFFFSYEGLRQRQGLTLNTDVLSDAQRAAAASPVTRRLLEFIPRANATGANGSPRFVGSATAPVDIDQGTLDITHDLSKVDRLHGYYALQRDRRGEPTLQLNSIPGFGDTRQSRRQIFTFNETHTFGPVLVNEARFGLNRIHISFTPNALLNPADFGINVGVNEPIGLPQISITGSALNFGGPTGFPQGRSDTTYVFSDTLSYLRGAHAFKFGGEFRRFLNNNFGQDPGTLGFANVNNFLAGTVSTFTVTLAQAGSNNVTSSISQGALGVFAQDNYKFRPNLTLELGFRYDWNMSPTERYDRFVNFDPATRSLVRVNQGLAPVYETNSKNFQPRVGFAWDPWGDGRTSVRGAYAVLVDQPVTNLVTGLASNPPFANPVALPATLPAGVTANFTNLCCGPGSLAAPGASLSPNATDLGFDNAYVQSWNLNAQREVGRGLGVTVGYFGSKGTHLRLTRNLNQLLPNGARPFPRVSLSSPVSANVPLLNVTEREGSGNSSYNALWVTAQKRLSRGLQFNASYTLSKSIDYNSQSSQGVTVQDSYNLRGDRGLSDFDARHRFVFSGLYELPFHGNQLVEGWELTTIVQSQSGNPVNLLAGNAVAITGATAANANALTGLATLRPDQVGTVQYVGTPNQWFTNTVCDPRPGGNCPAGAAFALPVSVAGGRTVYHFGSLGRNVIVGPRFDNVDFSVIKNTNLSEDVRVQFRAEFFDLFNHANFGQPGRTAQPGSTTFGVITNTRFATGDSGSSRQIQFALKLLV